MKAIEVSEKVTKREGVRGVAFILARVTVVSILTLANHPPFITPTPHLLIHQTPESSSGLKGKEPGEQVDSDKGGVERGYSLQK